MTEPGGRSVEGIADLRPIPGRYVWLNGQLLPTDTAGLSVLDHALTVGDGTFESILVVDGKAFALKRHLQRLRRTLSALELPLPFKDDELADAIAAVINANQGASEHVRLTVTAGIRTVMVWAMNVKGTLR